ncbi:sigma-54-dependent Fis family transcriptional regulator [candidate division KSB1 bacterium]|nr:sigma-54-dependent Fis family transcriptional regulator [candidate division KSB1 bacterium]MBL7094518.1 sigma-54-dependent Fis family transcriptional regulator [candidate division KSB1 bacterium]
MKERILIVDDEEDLTLGYSKCLAKVGYETKTANSGEDAIVMLREEIFDLIFLDIRLPKMDGLEVLKKALEMDPDLIVVMMTAHGTVESAVEAMRIGAHHYLMKGFDHEELRIVAKKALEVNQLKREVSHLKLKDSRRYPDTAIFGNSPNMKKVKDLIKVVATTPKTSVLIQGESGTGKELVAWAVHNWSARSEKAMIPINCSAIPEALMESELFGFEKGAFTDAKTMKKGVFELAHGGTIFLDEISSMSPNLQPKLLRVVETQSFRRIGGVSDIKINVRIIAATNQDLMQCIKDGTFREDLYYRLKVLEIVIPPLKERVEDIVPIAKLFIDQNNREFSKKIKGISEEAERLLKSYHWPGNVRELKNIIERATILCQDEIIQIEHLAIELQNVPTQESIPAAAVTSNVVISEEPVSLQEIEKRHIIKTLEKVNGNKSKAARILEISRSTLREKLKQYGIA